MKNETHPPGMLEWLLTPPLFLPVGLMYNGEWLKWLMNNQRRSLN